MCKVNKEWVASQISNTGKLTPLVNYVQFIIKWKGKNKIYNFTYSFKFIIHACPLHTTFKGGVLFFTCLCVITASSDFWNSNVYFGPLMSSVVRGKCMNSDLWHCRQKVGSTINSFVFSSSLFSGPYFSHRRGCSRFGNFAWVP